MIVPSGAVVRLTASGLGCPDWPLCDGGVVPAQAGHALIEYTNRILSGFVMVAAVLTWIVARGACRRRRPRAAPLVAGPSPSPTALQVPLGAVTVLTGLHPLAVGSHFLLSMVALACGDAPRPAGARLVATAWSAAGTAAAGPLAALVAAGRRGRCW